MKLPRRTKSEGHADGIPGACTQIDLPHWPGRRTFSAALQWRISQGTEACGNCAICLDAKTFMWNCSRHFCQGRRGAQSAAVRDRAKKFLYRCWPRMALPPRLPDERELLDCVYLHSKSPVLATRRAAAEPELERTEIAAEMERLFGDLPEAIANTQELSSRLNLR